SRLLPDRRRRRRLGPSVGRILRRIDYWSARLRAEEIHPEGGHAVHLRPDHPAAAVAAAGIVWKARQMTPLPSREMPAAARALAERHRPRPWEALPWLAA